MYCLINCHLLWHWCINLALNRPFVLVMSVFPPEANFFFRVCVLLPSASLIKTFFLFVFFLILVQNMWALRPGSHAALQWLARTLTSRSLPRPPRFSHKVFVFNYAPAALPPVAAAVLFSLPGGFYFVVCNTWHDPPRTSEPLNAGGCQRPPHPIVYNRFQHN